MQVRNIEVTKDSQLLICADASETRHASTIVLFGAGEQSRATYKMRGSQENQWTIRQTVCFAAPSRLPQLTWEARGVGVIPS